MHLTTSGEIPKKTSIFNREYFDSFIDANIAEYSSISKGSDCLYDNNVIISDPVINYLNLVSDDSVHELLKSLIKNEYVKLEKMYPNLGSMFIERYFESNSKKCDHVFTLSSDNIGDFLSSLKYETTKDIIRAITEYGTLEYTIDICQHPGKDIVCRKTKLMNFEIDYDFSFLGKKSNHAMKDFKFVVIDGVIESVGEIHHLLHEASTTKVPHVIFCFGISPEVKHVIIENNRKGITEVFPVCFNVEEGTLNILNDIAYALNSEVINSHSGQTISQAVRNSLKTGNFISFNRQGFSVDPVINDQKMASHRSFLTERIENSQNESNRLLLQNRLKRFSSKIFRIYVPSVLFQDTNFIRDLDYGLRFLKNSSRVMKKISFQKGKVFYYIPEIFLHVVDESIKSLKTTYSSLSNVILLVDEN